MLKSDTNCPANCNSCGGGEQHFTPPEERSTTIALMGQPNTGKSTLFNMLTGGNQHVGNWPGKTVEKKEGKVRSNGRDIYIYDLPGTYSLTANSLEERIARDFLIHEQPDMVIVVVDAAQLERSLYMLAEVVSLRVPIVVALNKIDMAEKSGLAIDVENFVKKTGFRTIPLVASRKEGISELLAAVVDCTAQQRSVHVPAFPEAVLPHYNDILRLLQKKTLQNYSPAWLAAKLLEGDEEVVVMTARDLPPETWKKIKGMLPADAEAANGQMMVAKARYEWIKEILSTLITSTPPSFTRSRFDTAATHPIWGKVIALGVLFLATIAAYLLSIPFMLSSFAVFMLSDPLQNTISGILPQSLCYLIGDGIMGGLGIALMILGFIGGVSAVLGILENSGYLARLAYCFDPFMRRIGLHGKSVMPLIMGMACNILGVSGTRVIDTWKQRLITLILVPIIPCKGMFILISFIIGVFFSAKAPFVFAGLAVVAALHIAVTSLLLQKFIARGERSGLIMELPPYHLPSLKNIWLFSLLRMKNFYRRGFWVIALSCIVVWFSIYFPDGSIDGSYLAVFGRKLEYFGRFVGWDWRFCIVFLIAVFSKETTLAAMAVIFGATTAADTDLVGMAMDGSLIRYVKSEGFSSFMAATGLSPASALSFVFAVFFSLPCFGTLAALYTETRSVLITTAAFCYYSFVSLTMGWLAYQAGLMIF